MKAGELYPSDHNIYLALGVLNFMRYSYEDAQQNFKTAVKLNPTDATLWNKYGAALLHGG